MDEEQRTFEDAARDSENMFAAAMAEENQTEQPAEEQTAETPTTPEETQTNEAVNLTTQAVTAAEAAANELENKNGQLEQVLQELNEVKQQNRELQDTLSQMSAQQEESIVEEMTKPVMPQIDFSSLAFEDEATVKQKQEDYARQMAEYVRGEVENEIKPFVEQAKEGLKQKEKEELFTVLKDIPELQGIDTMIPQLDRIISNNSILNKSDVPLDEKYITAYAIAKGVDSINHPKTDPTADDLMNYYNNNQDFRDMVERQRIAELQKGQQVPPMSASAGAVNAALNIKEKPKTFEEASERTRRMFGL